MKKHLVILGVSLFLFSEMTAQNEKDRAFIKEHTNTKVLNKISEVNKTFFNNYLRKGINPNVQLTITNSKNQIGHLSGFDKENNPVYDFDDNIDAAKTIGVNNIWTGGASGLNLNGSGIVIGHWEATGLAHSTHQELNGKITHAESSVITNDHATHTAGTMIGTGLDPQARGIASGATIISRKSDSDEAEIADFAAGGGILTNHSYRTGNTNNTTSVFGVYTDNVREWDEIMYNAPFLTMCKSAGNERNDVPAINGGDNGYDIINTVSGCKNLITVGAVNKISAYTGPQSVVLSTFGNWGPTDDWRIKPDFTAAGVDLYSSTYLSASPNDTSYSLKSGTSMATPTVTGAIALLQQHYHNKKAVYMRSATVKALLIATTDEVGANDGPDFQSGWGLVNAERAAKVISDNGTKSRISELTLNNGSTYTTTIKVDGTSALALTIAWTDPAGSPVADSEKLDNKTPMLVHDLDVRISKNSTVYQPWVMTPNSNSTNFTDAATKGDNFRDNVERIDISSLPQGDYTVTVTHKNSLSSSQNFSMVINGLSENDLSLSDSESKTNSIQVYPNPSENGFFNILIPNEIVSNEYSIKIFDLLGKEMKSSNHLEKQVNLDCSNLSTGMYIMKIQIGQNSYNQFVIIGK